MIQMGDDGKIRWNKLHYVMGDIGNTMQDCMLHSLFSRLTLTNEIQLITSVLWPAWLWPLRRP